jgi:hypothetical protein
LFAHEAERGGRVGRFGSRPKLRLLGNDLSQTTPDDGVVIYEQNSIHI